MSDPTFLASADSPVVASASLPTTALESNSFAALSYPSPPISFLSAFPDPTSSTRFLVSKLASSYSSRAIASRHISLFHPSPFTALLSSFISAALSAYVVSASVAYTAFVSAETSDSEET